MKPTKEQKELERLRIQVQGRNITRIIVACLFLIVAVFLCSCGSLKKDVSSTKETSQTQSITSSKKEFEKWGKNISQTLEPADLRQPMLISRNGKTDTVWNTRIINKTEYVKEIVKDTTSQKKEEVTEKKEDEKHIERDNTFVILGCFGLFLICIFAFMIVLINMQSKKIDAIVSLFQKNT